MPVSRLKRKRTDKGDYLAARKTERGRTTRVVLKTILPEVVLSLPFPKSMRWADQEITFARPIHTIVALLGDKTIPFAVGNVRSGRASSGHMFMAPGRVKLTQASDYGDALRQAHVVADIGARRALVVEEVARAAQAAGGHVLEDEELVDIVTNLVENPVATAGRFETDFLEVPREVLITAMREHQKYFAVVDEAGQLMPAFIALNNTRTRDLDLVASGHERVLRARLSDAQFFYRADLQVPAEERFAKLNGVLFQAALGSMRAKSERIAGLGRYLAETLGGDVRAHGAGGTGRPPVQDRPGQSNGGRIPQIAGRHGTRLCHGGRRVRRCPGRNRRTLPPHPFRRGPAHHPHRCYRVHRR